MPSRAEASPGWLYAPDLEGPGGSLVLSDDEAHYLKRVCRARPGDRATATNGRGLVATLRITTFHPHVRADVEAVERVAAGRETWVWTGAPEGERVDWMVEKLAELGVTGWQPLECERRVWERAAARAARWSRLAVAAMRQSRRAHLMDVREPVPLAEAMRDLGPDVSRWLASERGEPGRSADLAAPAVGVVGPSAGFSPAELERLAAGGFSPVRLSDSRLRTETAALAWVVWRGLG